MTPQEREQSDKALATLKEAALPLIEYLNIYHHPHTTAIVTLTGVELHEGIMATI